MNSMKMTEELGDKINWSQANLTIKNGVFRVIIGQNGRGEGVQSITVAKKNAHRLKVLLNHPIGEGSVGGFGKKHDSTAMT
jgi:hypothetical protein